METENTRNEQMEIARIRFGLIAPMVQGTFPDESLSAYCRRVSAFPVKLPDGRQGRLHWNGTWVQTRGSGNPGIGNGWRNVSITGLSAG